jgi:hypothetical protein
MKNIEALKAKIERLQAKWEQVAFADEFKGETKFAIMGTIEEEIYLTKQAMKQMMKTLGEAK